jgi:hypothetical protein
MGTLGKRALFRLPVKERLEAGKQLRARVPRSPHAKWIAAQNRPDPIELLKRSDGGKLPALLPIRYARMSNHAQFDGVGSVDGNIDDATSGKVLKAAPPRISQVALKFLF